MNTTNNTERRAIKGCPTFEIDVNGKVWNTVINRTMKEHINPAGFSYVIINGKFHTIAYLMKAAFFKDDNICIRHRDGNRANNKLSNLYTFFDGSEMLNPDGTEKKIITMEVNPQTNEVIKFWDSQREIAEAYNIDYNKLTYAITHCKKIDGHKFERYTAALDGLGLFDYSDGQHQIKIYECGELVKIASTAKEASKYTGDSSTAISHLLQDGGESRRGYSYEWKLSKTENEAESKAEPTTRPKAEPKKRERKVCQYSLSGELINTYNSVSEALPMTGVSIVTFYRALKGNDILPNYNKVLGGYIWMYEGKKFTYIHKPVTKAIKRPKKRKAVNQYSLSGELLHTYESINEAATANKLGQSQISHCAKGRTSSAGGCVWRYEGEAFDKYEIKTRGAKRVQQMVKNPDGTMTIIKEWESQMEAARDLNIAMQSVRDWARTMGSKQRSDGYYYRYSE